MAGAQIEPFYPRHAEGGARLVGLERMLRIHFLQQWYALSDPAVEEALYDSASMRRFVGIDLGRCSALDETTVCKFRHLLEKHGLAKELFKAWNQHLHDKGPACRHHRRRDDPWCTVVDEERARDPRCIRQEENQRHWHEGAYRRRRGGHRPGPQRGDDGGERG